MCLLFFLLDASLTNAHLLFKLAQTEAFISGTDTRDIRSNQIATHQLGRQYPPDRFRREVAEHLLLPDPQAKSPLPVCIPRRQRGYTYLSAFELSGLGL